MATTTGEPRLRRVLVTGAAGRLGRDVVAHFAASGVAITALDRVGAEGPGIDRVVAGRADDVAAVRQALVDAEAVVHLAALPSPHHGTAEEVFCGNTAATFTVLEQAAIAGVRRAVIASSYSITGLPFALRTRHPAYVPVDEQIPLQIEDPYGLGKQVDELIAAMMWWRHGLSVVALRFPFLGRLERELPERAHHIAEDPSFAASELWTYLDTRDAAAACAAALERAPAGCHVIGLAAPETLAPYPTATLLEAFHPDVPRRAPLLGRVAAIDTSRAAALLGWSASHLLAVEALEYPSRPSKARPDDGGPAVIEDHE